MIMNDDPADKVSKPDRHLSVSETGSAAGVVFLIDAPKFPVVFVAFEELPALFTHKKFVSWFSAIERCQYQFSLGLVS